MTSAKKITHKRTKNQSCFLQSSAPNRSPSATSPVLPRAVASRQPNPSSTPAPAPSPSDSPTPAIWQPACSAALLPASMQAVQGGSSPWSMPASIAESTPPAMPASRCLLKNAWGISQPLQMMVQKLSPCTVLRTKHTPKPIRIGMPGFSCSAQDELQAMPPASPLKMKSWTMILPSQMQEAETLPITPAIIARNILNTAGSRMQASLVVVWNRLAAVRVGKVQKQTTPPMTPRVRPMQVPSFRDRPLQSTALSSSFLDMMPANPPNMKMRMPQLVSQMAYRHRSCSFTWQMNVPIKARKNIQTNLILSITDPSAMALAIEQAMASSREQVGQNCRGCANLVPDHSVIASNLFLAVLMKLIFWDSASEANDLESWGSDTPAFSHSAFMRKQFSRVSTKIRSVAAMPVKLPLCRYEFISPKPILMQNLPTRTRTVIRASSTASSLAVEDSPRATSLQPNRKPQRQHTRT